MLYSTIRLLDTVMADCDDGGHISVFDFGGVKKKSKNRLVIMAHGSYLPCVTNYEKHLQYEYHAKVFRSILGLSDFHLSVNLRDTIMASRYHCVRSKSSKMASYIVYVPMD